MNLIENYMGGDNWVIRNFFLIILFLMYCFLFCILLILIYFGIKYLED